MLVLRTAKKNQCLKVKCGDKAVLIKYSRKSKSFYIHGDMEINFEIIESDIFRLGDDECEPEHSGNSHSVSKNSEHS